MKSFHALNQSEKPVMFKIYDSDYPTNQREWKNFNTHDPHILKDDMTGYYYIYSTDLGPTPGIPIRRSKDLVDWEYVGTALVDGIPNEVLQWTNAQGLWAPDIVKVKDEYRLYYSASTFGSQRSCIGLAVSNHPEGPFTHVDIVIKTKEGDPVNAIDANIVIEHESGDHYLVYGSFWSGIYLVKLNRETGRVETLGFGEPIANRPLSVEGAIEGAYIEYNEKTAYYYLFVSYGSLSSNYQVRVGRSKSIKGPYRDYNGNKLIGYYEIPNAIGYKLTSGYQFNNQIGWMALGHNSILKDDDQWYFISHGRTYQSKRVPYLQIRKLYWSQDGWPLLSPTLYGKEQLQHINESQLIGTFERIEFEDLTEELVSRSIEMTLCNDHLIKIGNVRGTWQLKTPHLLDIYHSQIKEQFIVMNAWDFQDEKQTIFITGKNEHGKCIWAKRCK